MISGAHGSVWGEADAAGRMKMSRFGVFMRETRFVDFHWGVMETR
jgi:hypothetical protein